MKGPRGAKTLNMDMDGIRIDSVQPTARNSVDEQHHTKADQAIILPFELRLTATKGLGLFATQDLPRGTRIISEKALLITPDESYPRIFECLKHLTPEQHDQFTSLACYSSFKVAQFYVAQIRHRLSKFHQYSGTALETAVVDDAKILAIFDSNAIPLDEKGKSDSKSEKGIFLLGARVNHSCLPNVHREYNATLGQLTIHATTDIKEGNELVCSYLAPMSHIIHDVKKRDALLRLYGVDCHCEACVGRENDKKRQKIANLIIGVVDYEAGKLSCETPRTPAQALDWAEDTVEQLKAYDSQGMALRSIYRTCSKYAFQIGNHSKALDYLHKALEVQRVCLGTETQHLGDDGAEAWIKVLEAGLEKDRVKLALNRKREQKEEKKAEKKAAKKAAKTISR